MSFLRGIILLVWAVLQNRVDLAADLALPATACRLLHKKSKRTAVTRGRSGLLGPGVTDVAWPAFGPNLPP